MMRLLFTIVLAFWTGALSFSQAETPLRPREAALERDYRIEQVSLTGGLEDVRLAGELTRPHGEGRVPGLVLITGSGPQDRDETTGGHRPFLILSDHLVRNGFAVLRFDDRGVGESTGDFDAATVPDFAADAAAAMRWLKDQPFVDASRTGYVGHSEGGLVAPLAARVESAAFLVLLAAPALPFEEILQLRTLRNAALDGTPKDATAQELRRTEAVFEVIRRSSSAAEARGDVEARLVELGASAEVASGWAQAITSPALYWVARYDPAPTLKSFDGPVLAVYPAEDTKIAPRDNARAVRRLVEHGASKAIVVPGLNHLFQPVGAGQRIAYEDSEVSFDDSALNVIQQWIDDSLAGAMRAPR